jgi:hypothetical protein
MNGHASFLRRGAAPSLIGPLALAALWLDFMIVEISGDDLFFQAISRTGETVDSGVVHRPGAPAAGASTAPGTSPPR